MNEQLRRACEALARAQADIAILGSVANVTYVTGVEVPIPFGAMAEFTYAPWLAVIPVRDERGWLVLPNFAADRVAPEADGFETLGFDTFDSFSASDPRGTYLSQVQAALTNAGWANKANLAIESRSVPAMVITMLTSQTTQATIIDAESALAEARRTKTDRELELLRHSAHLADIGHNTLALLVQEAGRNEIDMWTEIGAAIYKEEGREIMLSGELVTGPRTASVHYPNGPWSRVTVTGDAALMDLSGRVNGYWFDCTNTHVIGGVEPIDEQLRFAQASQDACHAAMAVLKPGAKASDVAAAAKKAFAAHGLPMAHYAGHQVGVTVNELPRLVPYDDSLIETGMVFSVEPGAYQGPGGTFGARSEKMVLVRDDGPEILSKFEWGI